jgi:hypothetical protein
MASPSRFNEDYLGRELRARLACAPIRFVLCVQREKDASSTPIEDCLVEWQERDSPSIPVAELILEREVDALACHPVRFTPGHYIPEHRPLSNMGRGRVFSYASSQDGRHAPVSDVSERTLFAV